MWSQHEIDSYDDRFQTANETGQALLDANHEASDEVLEKVIQFNRICESLIHNLHLISY